MSCLRVNEEQEIPSIMRTTHHNERPVISARKAISGLAAFLLWMVLAPQNLFAAQIVDLYQVNVPVKTQSVDERDKAFGQALGEVVVRVTGQKNSLSNVSVRQAQSLAKSYVQSFSYQKELVDDVEQLLLYANFDERAVNRMLRASDLGIWDGNRPDTLLWLAVEQNGKRSIQVNDGGSPLMSALESATEKRALPFTLPLMDFEDSANISVVDVWGLFTSSLQKASRRYGSESILAGRLSYNGERYTGRVVLLFRNQRFDAEIQLLSERQLAQAITDLVGNNLSSHYAIRSVSDSENPVLEIENVSKVASYAGVIDYLKSLTSVRDVMVINVKGDRLMLELVIDGTLSQLSDAIALGRQLKSTGNDSVGQRLRYRWVAK